MRTSFETNYVNDDLKMVKLQILFEAACVKGDLENVKNLLVFTSVDPACRHNYAIRAACLHGYTEIVKLLLTDPRVDPSDQGDDALITACEKGHIEIVKALIKSGKIKDDGIEAAKKASSPDLANKIDTWYKIVINAKKTVYLLWLGQQDESSYLSRFLNTGCISKINSVSMQIARQEFEIS